MTNKEQAKRFLAAAETDRYHGLHIFSYHRDALGELGGLLWSDVDTEARVVRVRHALIIGYGGQSFQSLQRPRLTAAA